MRKLTVLTLVLLYVLSLAAVSAFAANAGRTTTGTHMVSLDSRQQPMIETDNGYTGGKPSQSAVALGYYMSPGIQLGTTAYDIQHNSHMGRQVVLGADGRVNFIWTNLAVGASTANRAVYYRTSMNGVLTTARDVSGTLSQAPGRFCSMDNYGNRAVITYHWGGGPITTAVMNDASGSANFTAEDTPSDVINCQGIAGGGSFTDNYIWPQIAVDNNGSNLLIHILAQEGKTGAEFCAITYFRGVSTGQTIEDGMFGTCGTFIDSTSATDYDIAADPNSNKVGIAYSISRQANRENNDLGVRISTDLGVTWQPKINVTNYATGALERKGMETSCLFTSDGCFHVIFIGTNYDSVANSVSDQACKLYHWSDCNPTCKSLILDAANEDAACSTPAFRYNINAINLSECVDTAATPDSVRLYAVYSRNLGSTTDPDCSQNGYFNGELFVSVSATGGETWGAPVNLSNTKTNACAAGACEDEARVSAARYNIGQLHIEFLHDLDPGSFAGNESSTAELANPVKYYSYPCFAMDPYQQLSSTPSRIKYPFHAVVGATAQQVLHLTNAGNQPVNWTSSILPGATTTVSLAGSGTVQAGCTNSADVTVTVGPNGSEGLFHATIRFTYQGGAKTLDVPVDFYVFNSWFLKQDVTLRTASNKMVVNQVTQAANDIGGSSYTYFADLSEDFITDGSLIIGNSAQNLSWRVYESGQGDPGSPLNNFGWLYALSNTTYDSTSFPYRIASGSGTNRDSTVSYDIAWYACKHVDSSDFYVAHFDIYKGPKNPSSTITGLTVAYGIDWDVPSDTSSDNTIGYDATRQMIYLQGQYSAARQQGFGATAAYREDGQPIKGGLAWGNQQQVYSWSGFQVDSVWKYTQLVNNSYTSTWDDSVGDMSTIMVVEKNLSVAPGSHFLFDVVLSGKRAQTNTAGLAGLNTSLDQAKKFICTYIAPTSALCAAGCDDCGDANSDGTVDISDAVFLISHIFAGGAAPADCNYPKGMGDANGDQTVDISDAVYLISRIFSGGAPPHCYGM